MADVRPEEGGETPSLTSRERNMADVRPDERKGMPSLEKREGLFSLWSYAYLSEVVKKAQKRSLMHEDLLPLGSSDLSSAIQSRFEVLWASTERTGSGDLFKAFVKFMPNEWFMSVWLEVVTRGLLFSTPFILKVLIEHVQGEHDQSWMFGLGLCIVMGAVIAFSGFTENRMQALLAKISFSMQAIIMGQIFRKYFRLAPSSICEADTGLVLNMIGEDTQRIFQLMPMVNFLWSAPLQMLVAMALMVLFVGILPTLGGAAVLLVTLATMKWTNDLTQKLERKRAKMADKRIRFVAEVLSGIKVVKLYAWEEAMEHAISRVRSKELRKILEIFILRCSNVSIFNIAPVIMSVAIFVIYTAQGHDLDAATVFSTVTLVNLIRAPLILLPILQSSYNASRVSFDRIFKYLNLPERAVPKTGRDDMSSSSSLVTVEPNTSFRWPTSSAENGVDASAEPAEKRGEEKKEEMTSIEMVDVETKESGASKSQTTFRLRVSLRLRAKELVQVVGPVGCGKSALLRALLSDMVEENGRMDGARIRPDCSVAYVPQQSWLMNASIRENILFGRDFDEKRYEEVIFLAALRPDIARFARGDATLVGENGIGLSGGQKQRISLARALYSDADVYLLDDPLSAVDQHVAAHIFFSTIHTFLRNKAVLLVTHQLQFLKYATRVVCLDQSGTMRAEGTYAELASKHLVDDCKQVELSEWLKDDAHVLKFTDDAEPSVSATKCADADAPVVTSGAGESKGGDESKKSKKKSSSSRPRGGAPLAVHLTYFRAAGPLWSIALLGLFYVVTQLLVLATEYVLAVWTGDFFDESDGFYLSLYAGVAFVSTLAVLARLVWFSVAAWRASTRIHRKSVRTMLGARIGYHQNTPTGATTALFSRDQGMIDTYLSELYNVEMTLIVMLLVSLVVVSVILPYCFIGFIPVLVVAWYIQKQALPAVSNVQMLNLMSLGPVFSLFSESMEGLSVIRSSGKIGYCIERCDDKIDRLNNAYYHSQLTTKWLDVRMDLASGIIVGACSAVVVSLKDELSVELVSLLLGYLVACGAFLGYIVQIRAFLEMMVSGVERCDNFHTQTPMETKDGSSDLSCFAKPTLGLKNVDFRYENPTASAVSESPLVLKGLSCTFPKGKRIAVIGRTGAGKSTLINAITRMNEIDAGEITIGSRNIGELSLRALRKRIAIIPQDPVLFTGTVRSNLDPFSHRTDAELWDALRRVQLDKTIQKLPQRLAAPVKNNGSNFSIGQRQLVCVARALLTKSEFLLMDEATASVDYATDAKLQKMIREEFSDRTVLTIAHRIKTIVDYDFVLGLDNGRACEFGSPHDLLKDPTSYFSTLLTEEQKKEAGR